MSSYNFYNFATIAKIKQTKMMMTPAKAQSILTANKIINRPLNKAKVASYARTMTSGKWRPDNGEGIIFSKNGNLMNGTHRLNAVIVANIAVPFLVTEGVEENTFPTIDDGASRTAGDVLAISGIKNSSTVASITKIALNYRDNKPLTQSGRGLRTNLEIDKAVARHPEISIFVDENRDVIRIGRSITLGALYIAHQFGPADYQDKILEFSQGVSSGANLSQDDPRLIYRNKMIQFRSNRTATPDIKVFWTLAVNSLTNYIDGKSTRLFVPSDPTFIEIKFVPRELVKSNW